MRGNDANWLLLARPAGLFRVLLAGEFNFNPISPDTGKRGSSWIRAITLQYIQFTVVIVISHLNELNAE